MNAFKVWDFLLHVPLATSYRLCFPCYSALTHLYFWLLLLILLSIYYRKMLNNFQVNGLGLIFLFFWLISYALESEK